MLHGMFSLAILYIVSVTHRCQSVSPNSSHFPPSPFGIHIFVLYISVSVSVLQIRSSIPFL